MDNISNQNTITKNAANYGLILGLAIMIYTLILHFLGAGQNQVAGWVNMIFMVVAIQVGTKSLRDNIQEGYISYGRAVGSGMLIILFASVIQAFFIYLFYTYVSPEGLQNIFTAMEESMMQQGSSDDEIEMTVKLFKSVTTPASMAIATIFSSAFWGLVISLITSAFLKKEKSIFED